MNRGERALAVVVLGMHRSGTSALTGCLHLLGVPLGGPLLPAGPDNERGFWELEDVARIHERLLASFGASHLDLANLPERWRETPAAREAKAQLAEVLVRNFEQEPLWAVKDPRLAILLPLWDEVFAELGVTPRFCLTHRSPWEVARSLGVRNRTTARAALALWERHVSAAERSTRDRRRAFTSYERLLRDPVAELARLGTALGVAWPVAPREARDRIAAFLSPALRHWTSVGPSSTPATHDLASAAELAASAIDALVSAGESRGALERLEQAAEMLATASLLPPPTRRVLFVSHDASRTGAPLLLLGLIDWLKEHARVEPRIVLRAGGPLEADFRALGDTVVGNEPPGPEFLAGVTLIWANTATNGRYLAMLARDDLPLVTHVHELPYALAAFGREGLVHLIARTTRFVACSEQVAENLSSGEGVPPERVTVLYEAIDVAGIAARSRAAHREALREELGLPPETLVVVGAGSADWRKGTDLFLQVARQVTAQRADVAFVWAGRSPAPLEELRIRHDLAALGWPARIRLLGERADLAPVLDAADVFLLPSREDPLPLVLLEAAALGKPAICFEGAGGGAAFCRETGRVVPYLDVPAMTGAVEELLASPDLRLALGARARARVAANHELALLGESAAALIAELALPEAPAPPSASGTHPAASPLPDEGFRAEWVATEVPARVRSGELFGVRMTIRNASGYEWPDDLRTGNTGRYAVRLGWRWTDVGGRVTEDPTRQELPAAVPPGSSVLLTPRIPAPIQPGNWTLQLDLVQELVAWFEWKGTPRFEASVVVE